MLQSLYKCQINLCTHVRKTNRLVQSVATNRSISIPSNESKSRIELYDRKSYGLSKEPLINEGKVLQLEPDTCSEVSAVVEFLQKHGFSAAQVKKIIRQRPCLLVSRVEKTLEPKLMFLQSIGISEDEYRKMICWNPNILLASLRKQLIPCFDSLTNFMGSKALALAAVKRSPQILNTKMSHSWNQTVQVLHQIGIPDYQVSEFIIKSPIILTINPEKMSKVGLKLKEMGFDATSPAFRAAFTLMSKASHSNVKGKWETYRSMGFCESEILDMFRLQPTCMFYSEENIRAIVGFYVDRLHLSPSHLSQRPVFLLRSLERRVIPRCSVMQVLWSRGIISQVGKLSSILMIREKDFLERYVTRYEAQVPQVQAAYRGKLEFKEYTFHFREISILERSSSKTEVA